MTITQHREVEQFDNVPRPQHQRLDSAQSAQTSDLGRQRIACRHVGQSSNCSLAERLHVDVMTVGDTAAAEQSIHATSYDSVAAVHIH